MPKNFTQSSTLASTKTSRADKGGHPRNLRFEDNQDIFVDDLDATLEAHRATNRAKIIRTIENGTDPGVKRPDDAATITVEPHSFTNAQRMRQDEGDTDTGVKFVSILRPDDAATINVESHPSTDAVKTAKESEHTNPHKPSLAKDRTLKSLEIWPVGTVQHSKMYHGKVRAPKGTVQEYRSCAIIPTRPWRHGSNEILGNASRPWLRTLKEPEGDALQRLGNEIKAFAQYMTPSKAEMNATRKVSFQVQNLIKFTLNDSSCDVIGSYSTGLALPFSDIDFSVSFPAVEAEAATYRKSLRGLEFQKIYRKAMYRLRDAFNINPNFDDNPELVFARIPIVRASHRTTGQEIQVQIQTGRNLQQQHTLAYLAEYPSLQPLYVALRSCLEIRGLSKPYEGGLGSYPILIMIVNALKHAWNQHDPDDLGSQLLHVLDFYASHDLYRYGFSVDPPRLFRKDKTSMGADERAERATDLGLSGIESMPKPNALRPYLLSLQDPADPTNDLGRNAYAIKHIQKTFATARQSIQQEMEVWDRGLVQSQPDRSTAAGLLDALVHADYGKLASSRAVLGRFSSSNPPRTIPAHDKQSSTASRDKGKVSVQEMLEKVIEIDQRKVAENGGQKDQDASTQPQPGTAG
ncbi:MAG: hypothetical protein Q9224_001258 [Gallowayella concinna]